MYTDDFTAIVRKYANPASHINFHKTRFGPLDTCTILDYAYPRRTGACVTGHAEFDWYTSSQICNFTIPEQTEYGVEGKWVEELRTVEQIKPAHWDPRPITGYIAVLTTMLKDGALIPAATIDKLIRKDSCAVLPSYLTYLRLLYGK